jgi:hypothetical protein
VKEGFKFRGITKVGKEADSNEPIIIKKDLTVRRGDS